MSPETRFRLEDMSGHAREALAMLGDRDAAAVAAERMRELALIRLVEVVGEAAARVSVQEREQLPALPWREAVGLRNILIHGYGQVRTDIVVATIREHFPTLIATLDRILGTERP